ncbi:MAG: TIGR02757 family protein [Bacteroidia bacterium]|nr:TIGR02757 family protein [Bacteroidia bacterium]
MSLIAPEDLKSFLDQQHDRYNTPDFILEDPVSIPHEFSKKEDIEISGFFSALIAWGRRDIIIRNARKLMERMEWAPFDFVLNAEEEELDALSDYVHRTFNGEDLKALILGLRRVYQEEEGLEGIFSKGIKAEDSDIGHAIIHARTVLSSSESFPKRSHKHLANPAKGSSAKRISMYLRWMVRKDDRGVDFGIWEGIRMDQLICPLDVHTGTIARKLGILQRKQNDWKAACELTNALKEFDPQDPVKYDYALFGLGAYNEL